MCLADCFLFFLLSRKAVGFVPAYDAREQLASSTRLGKCVHANSGFSAGSLATSPSILQTLPEKHCLHWLQFQKALLGSFWTLLHGAKSPSSGLITMSC